MSNILLIDNYDSFTYNLAQYLWELNFSATVCRNDKITLKEIEDFSPSHIIISPGPGTPRDSGISLQAIEHFYTQIPILGICLGHQCLGEFFGAQITNLKEPRHGKTSQIHHNSISPIFEDIPTEFIATRYHSLIIEPSSLGTNILDITATSTDDKQIMAIQHKTLPLYGLQFHPESIKTEYGHSMLKNFINKTS